MNRLLCFLSVSLALTLVARAGSPAEDRLRTALDQSLAIAEAAPSTEVLMEKIRPVVVKNMSFEAMTRRAIGPGWRQFTPTQQASAITLFTELIIRRYAGRFTIGEKASVTHKPATTPAPGRVEVPTLLLYKGSRYEVIYRLEQSEDWRITDVVVEGVSFIANYRSQFDAQFKKGGPTAVLAALQAAVEKPQ
jgi:phospholipid transport system substrate-binding protein